MIMTKLNTSALPSGILGMYPLMTSKGYGTHELTAIKVIAATRK